MSDDPLHEDDLAILRAIPARWLDAHGVPDPQTVDAATRAEEAVRRVLGPAATVRRSPLGPGWSRDLDVHVDVLPDGAVLRDAGWVQLDHLLGRTGRRTRGRWAIVVEGEVLAALDLSRGPAPGPVETVLRRSRDRGEVRARELLELRVLARRGTPLREDDPVVTAASRLEIALGGDPVLASSRRVPMDPGAAPVPLRQSPGRRVRRRLGSVRQWVRPRVTVGLSGVDGAGKSSAATALVAALRRAGVPAGKVWTRPGMGLRWLDGSIRRLKSLMGRDPAPVMREAASGGDAATAASRRGFVGWMWTLVVVGAFLLDTWRQRLRVSGVVVHDRHLADALVTLELLYGDVDLRIPRGLVRRLLPRAHTTFYLDIGVDEAVSRKPDEVFNRHAVETQLAAYRRVLGTDVIPVDATLPQREIVLTMLEEIARP